MSPTYVSAFVALGMGILGIFKINLVSSEELTKVIEAVVILVTTGIIIVRRFKKGDITVVGSRKKTA